MIEQTLLQQLGLVDFGINILYNSLDDFVWDGLGGVVRQLRPLLLKKTPVNRSKYVGCWMLDPGGGLSAVHKLFSFCNTIHNIWVVCVVSWSQKASTNVNTCVRLW